MSRSPRDTMRDPSRRGYSAVYRLHEANACPGCGRSQWYVGRLLAECGFCATALPLHEGSCRGDMAVHTSRGRPVSLKHAA